MKEPRILITGASGFIGSALVRLLHKNNEVYLTARSTKDGEKIYPCNLTDKTAVHNLVSEIRPQQIYHMAGVLTGDLDRAIEGNVIATKHILDAIRDLQLDCRVLLLGSAGEYGLVGKGDNPVQERQPLHPVSVNGLSKKFQTALMDFYVRMYGMDVVMARVFNVMGEGASEHLFIGRIEREIERYKKGENPAITTGTLDSIRDYISVEEVANACRIIMKAGISGEIYNVGSGKGIRMRDFLYGMLDARNISRGSVVERKSKVIGKWDIPEIYADISKLKKLQSI